jgi:S1-C subfamily serine protease
MKRIANIFRTLLIVCSFFNIAIYSQINQKILPTVVSLRQEVNVETISKPVFDKNDELIGGSVTEKSTEIINRGSGTIISSSGLILTNYHVWNFSLEVEKDAEKGVAYRIRPNTDDMYVYMLDPDNILKEPKKKYIARFVGGDKNKDIAILKCMFDAESGSKVKSLNLPFMNLGNPFGINFNGKLSIAGYPGIGGKTITLTEGKFLGYYSDQNCTIKTDAAISYGNSGGAAIYLDKIIGIPTEVSTQKGGANFGYIYPVTYAVGPLTKLKIKNKEDIPNIDKNWIESSLNSEASRNNLYLGFQVKSAMTNQPISSARVIIYRGDRTYDQIEQLNDELQKTYSIFLVKEYSKKGYSVKNIAKTVNLSESDVRTALNINLDDLQLSDDLRKHLNNDEFFFIKGETDKDGFFFTSSPIPRNQYSKMMVITGNSKKIEKNFQTDNAVYQDLGIILLY